MANDPALVLADEPTGNLDTKTGREMVALFRQLNRDLGQTFVVVSHDPSIAAQADTVFRMKDGEIVETTRNSEAHSPRPLPMRFRNVWASS